MNRPTQEQIKEFWEQCNISKPPCDRVGGCLKKIDPTFSCKCDKWEYPTLDLNNLFKYAVPKLEDPDIGFYLYAGGLWEVNIEHKGSPIIEEADDPALALFWALRKVMEDKDG